MISYDSKRVAKNIDLRLAELGISKKQFYKESGISSATLSQWNTGANTPTSKKLKQAADYLNMSVYELTGEKAERGDKEESHTAFYEKFVEMCAGKNVSPSAVANAIGLSGAAASGWKKGAIPSDVTLQKLADYFDVNKAALTGGNIVDRIRKLCRMNDTSITKLEEELGYANGTIGKWAKAKKKPPLEKVLAIASRFGVSTEYLYDGSGCEGEKEKPIENDGLTPAKWALLESVNGMTDEQIYKILPFIEDAKNLFPRGDK